VVRFAKDDRKIDVMRRYVLAQARSGRSGVAAIGIAQEFQNVFLATLRDRSSGVPLCSFTKADRRVTCFYFHLWDDEFGPGFITIATYFPYPMKVWVNVSRVKRLAGLRSFEMWGRSGSPGPGGCRAPGSTTGPRAA
jgi:hypothetical protein